MSQTHVVGAGRQKPPVDAMMTEIALAGNIFFRVECNGFIRTGVDTRLAACALLVIQDHNTVFSFADGLHRTGLGTSGIIAVPADIYVKNKIQLAINNFRSILANIDYFDPVRTAVFLLAGHLAGLAPPTEFMLYAQCVGFHEYIPSEFASLSRLGLTSS
jgi:hypothetical protein